MATASARTLGDRLAERHPGEQVMLTVFRRDELRHVPLTLGQRPYNKLTIHARADATVAEKTLYEAWLRAPWPIPSQKETDA